MLMGILTQRRRAYWQARLEAKEAQLAAAEIAYSSLLAKEVDSYKFDSGEGSQSAHRRKLAEFDATIKKLEAEIEALYNRLAGMGLTNLTLRREL